MLKVKKVTDDVILFFLPLFGKASPLASSLLSFVYYNKKKALPLILASRSLRKQVRYAIVTRLPSLASGWLGVRSLGYSLGGTVCSDGPGDSRLSPSL